MLGDTQKIICQFTTEGAVQWALLLCYSHEDQPECLSAYEWLKSVVYKHSKTVDHKEEKQKTKQIRDHHVRQTKSERNILYVFHK